MNNVDISYTFIAKAMLRDSLLCAIPLTFIILRSAPSRLLRLASRWIS